MKNKPSFFFPSVINKVLDTRKIAEIVPIDARKGKCYLRP